MKYYETDISWGAVTPGITEYIKCAVHSVQETIPGAQ